MSHFSLSHFFEETNMIATYTRREAIADGVLVDVSSLAKEAGFTVPVAVTSSVWEQYIVWSEQDTERQVFQNTKGRLWDILFMLRLAIQGRGTHANVIFYKLRIVPKNGKTLKPKLTRLKAVMGPGDLSEPVVTVMLPHED